MEIERFKVSCGCLSARLDTKTIEPSSSCAVSVHLKGSKSVNKRQEMISFTLAGSELPVQLQISIEPRLPFTVSKVVRDDPDSTIVHLDSVTVDLEIIGLRIRAAGVDRMAHTLTKVSAERYLLKLLGFQNYEKRARPIIANVGDSDIPQTIWIPPAKRNGGCRIYPDSLEDIFSSLTQRAVLTFDRDVDVTDSQFEIVLDGKLQAVAFESAGSHAVVLDFSKFFAHADVKMEPDHGAAIRLDGDTVLNLPVACR